ncbi:MAG: hypothetical protein HRT35_18155 [Algicola sp.]|nr:hypothetical protein [Algicola sp.]
MKNFVGKTLAAAIAAAFMSCAAAQEVELVSTWNMNMSYYGQSWKDDAFTVVVKDLGADKKVSIYHQAMDGSWVDLPMYYHGPADNGKMVYKSRPGFLGGSAFSIKYQVNGQTYWDNNHGQNFSYPNGGGYNIIDGSNVHVGTYNTNSSDPYGNKLFSGRVAINNLAYSKVVKLVYSQDNWQTSKAVYAEFGGSPLTYGYGSVQNPNGNNIEAWTFSEYVSAERGEFYVDYEVLGQHYYDNNHGLNYVLNPLANYASMALRHSPHWESVRPMTLVRDNTWMVNLSVSQAPVELKFDASGDWSINFGDNNADGMAEQNGGNIVITENGNYRLTFNDQTLAYGVQKLDAVQ